MMFKIYFLSVFVFFIAPIIIAFSMFNRYLSFCQSTAIEVLDEVHASNRSKGA